MANEEHLKILKQGVVAWNKWRTENPDVIPDLSDTNLDELSFVGRAQIGSLSQYTSHLDSSALESLDLSLESLERPVYMPDFYNFKNVDFEFSNFQFTLFKWADLRGATFDSADLTGTCFDSVFLDDANLSGTFMRYTRFMDTDLSKVSLRHVDYLSASNSMDIDTLIKSIGNIPEDLLDSFDVPKSFIDAALTLSREFYSCFISYSNADIAFTQRLYSDLRNRGVRCWFAPENLRTGDRIRQKIEDSIYSYDKLLIILSKNSISSPWVEDEVETAIEREHMKDHQVLFPIRIDNSVLESEQAWSASLRRKYQISDFSNAIDSFAYMAALNRLLDDLKKK